MSRYWLRNAAVASLVCTGALALASCLVDQKEVKNYSIKLPSTLVKYVDGHEITLQYVQFLVNGAPQPTSGGVTFRWQNPLATLTLPFTGEPVPSVLRYVVTQSAEGGELAAVQYVSQNDSGSLFLRAFEGVGVTVQNQVKNSYWPVERGPLTVGAQPLAPQVFWSPIEDGAGNSQVGVDHPMTFDIVGPCDSASCPTVAAFTITNASIDGIQEVETSLGTFATYHLSYQGNMTPTQALATAPPHFDYRTACWTPGSAESVSFFGSVWIFPPIGPVQIQNDCISGAGPSATTHSYIAKITKTNIKY